MVQKISENFLILTIWKSTVWKIQNQYDIHIFTLWKERGSKCHSSLPAHCVEISRIFCHSDFTWNQFWRGSEFWILCIFCTFWKLKLSNLKNFRMEKTAIIVDLSFLHHSDFTWNRICVFWKCKIYHFCTFRGSDFLFLWIFALFEGWNLPT